MKIEPFKIYRAANIENKIKITYDKTSKKRPAWIWITGLPNDTVFINVKINGKRKHYKVYLHPRIPLFMPVDYTKEEMKKFYNRYSDIYDSDIEPRNLPVARLLLSKLKLPENARVLDLGAGTGLSSIPYAEKGYSVVLVDYSKGMLSKAKKRKVLKNCKFIQSDIRKLKLNDKYDLVTSIFSFGSNTYFDEKEMPKLWKMVHSLLKPKGKIAVYGFDYAPPAKLFKKLKTGEYDILKTGKDYFPWIIAEKK